MEYFDGIHPMVLIFGGMAFIAVVYFWNKKNTQTNSDRRKRSFKQRHDARKRESDKEDEK